MNTYFGIDYGSKYTGNTVVAILQGMDIFFMEAEKKVDADQFILNAAEHFKPRWVFIDAPLSLPGIYRQLASCDNYHFRRADIECRAMSPMFLGGLAARAIELKDKLQRGGAEVYETYPKIRAEKLDLPAMGYKKVKGALPACAEAVTNLFKSPVRVQAKDILTWHHLDALLALMSAMAHESDQCEVYGNPLEGLIYV